MATKARRARPDSALRGGAWTRYSAITSVRQRVAPLHSTCESTRHTISPSRGKPLPHGAPSRMGRGGCVPLALAGSALCIGFCLGESLPPCSVSAITCALPGSGARGAASGLGSCGAAATTEPARCRHERAQSSRVADGRRRSPPPDPQKRLRDHKRAPVKRLRVACGARLVRLTVPRRLLVQRAPFFRLPMSGTES